MYVDCEVQGGIIRPQSSDRLYYRQTKTKDGYRENYC